MTPTKIRRAKVAMVLLIAFLTVVVVIADTGNGDAFFGWVNRVPAGDKAGHFLLFGLLSFLVNLLWRGERVAFLRIKVLKGSAVIGSLVVLEECSQLFFRSRTFDLIDLAADFAGIWAFGVLACLYLRSRRQPRANDPRSVIVSEQ